MATDSKLCAQAAESPAGALLLRLRKRLTQTEISKRTGIPQPTLSRWETGGVADAADDAMKLAQLEAELTANDSTATPYSGPERRKASHG